MSTEFTKPNILISKCIEIENCRYNGQIISSEFVKSLKPFVNLISVCPEVEIGLGVPREPIRIVSKDDKRYLIQPSTDKNVTKDMQKFISKFLAEIKEIDGVILKSRSPSCGLKDVKIYPTKEKSAPIMRSAGFFGDAVLKHFNNCPIEDEARLRNSIIKEDYLRKIFTFASFRKIKDLKDINRLIEFHSNNKFLLMGYSQKYLSILGNIVANKEKLDISKIYQNYEKNLHLAMSKPLRCNSNKNVLSHAFGYVSKNLNSKEKQLFLESVENFEQGRISISVPINLLKSWVLRFDEDYLANQTFFSPYPEELLDAEAKNICSVRDYWK
jgi:uncharacterized protein YbgA (DUF1722 family)/uncharacterized protein YbbK (DUF523 family)